ncbi:TPA: spore coat protein CotJB [Clostridium perfringens]|uniref:spore coat protein CotJB n=1 Tax=Clostridium perfringens TaxID=1502 RepID=UPI001A213CA4|nr:spore coat protein CotJB [Clostridium perfringens]MCC5434381.1 spore coat protein CotJB [Clostridium perfringens]MCC5437353.1 spore coat protein CotJB [Clostridium perfringens]UBK72267.1 spore coat protein CotJB [Clostridium perfringens]UBK76030.1 spore coat protein CotJB [Clostridium perfringens]HAT4133069.1 spore coat protein CotJB [Clostridium perfringens]
MKALELLDDIQKLQFYAVELNLYLDNFPENRKATEDYKEISSKLSELIERFECEYGPIRNFGDAYIENPVAWIEQPWPWEIKC